MLDMFLKLTRAIVVALLVEALLALVLPGLGLVVPPQLRVAISGCLAWSLERICEKWLGKPLNAVWDLAIALWMWFGRPHLG